MEKCMILLLSLLFAACGQNPDNKAAETEIRSDGVEVLAFHAKKRCPTCIAVERLTREVIETQFAARLADGSLTFRVVNIAEEEALADKYEITWSALLVNRYGEGAEVVNDLTRFAFAHARTNPEKFKAELKAEIEKLLDR